MVPPHMSPDEFRVVGRRMVEFIAAYWETLETLRVTPDMKPGDVLRQLPMHPPSEGLVASLASDDGPTGESQGLPGTPSTLTGESWDPVFADLSRTILPALTHWQSPNFFGYFPANASFPAILGEMLSAGLGQQGMLWATSPACTELEIRVLDWFAEMLHLPDAFKFESRGQPTARGGGVIQGTASESLVSAIVAARFRALRTLGGGGESPSLVAYASTQAHSSFIKACMIAGLAASPEDRSHCRLIEVDDDLAMRPGALESAMRADLDAGRVPFFVMGTIGTTSSTAVDPIAELAEVIGAIKGGSRVKPWLHVDAAHAGSMLVCPEFGHLGRGLASADSFCFNPHKWLLTNFDCDCFYTSDREALTGAMSVTPEYLRNAASESGAVDFRDWHVPLGRRFRALKLWFVVRHYGVEGLRSHIREHVRLAQVFERLVRDDPRFEVAAARTMNLVCFRLVPRGGTAEPAALADARNREFLDRLNATGRLFLSHTVLPATSVEAHPRLVLRMAIGGTLTREDHVRSAWRTIQKLADQ
jgi:aromatic-L-amino-acid/L-tryptophan decarboxylase